MKRFALLQKLIHPLCHAANDRRTRGHYAEAELLYLRALVLDLLDALQTGRDLSTVAGISYEADGKIIHNPDRPFVTNLDIIPDLSIVHKYKSELRIKLWFQGRVYMNVIQASRGCPFTCSFCYGIRQLGIGYRMRSIDNIIADIRYRIEYSGSRNAVASE